MDDGQQADNDDDIIYVDDAQIQHMEQLADDQEADALQQMQMQDGYGDEDSLSHDPQDGEYQNDSLFQFVEH